jgi:hypothetical protein
LSFGGLGSGKAKGTKYRDKDEKGSHVYSPEKDCGIGRIMPAKTRWNKALCRRLERGIGRLGFREFYEEFRLDSVVGKAFYFF